MTEIQKQDAEVILKVARYLLSKSVSDDYLTRVMDKYGDAIVGDVLECSGIADGEGFSDDDVKLAIGRVMLGIA